jgi:Uma2 family endonuclease
MAAATLIDDEPVSSWVDAPPQRLGQRSNGMLMTTDEFLAIEDCDRDFRYELVHGVVVVSPPAGPGERKSNDVIGFWLQSFQQNDPRGKSIDETLPEQEIVTSTGVRRADRAIWVGLGRAPDTLHDVPTIAIEFLSGSTRDRRRDFIEKRSEYAAAGVKEYWIIDRHRAQLVIGRGMEPELILKDGVYQTPLIPGFELSIPALLAACNRYR